MYTSIHVQYMPEFNEYLHTPVQAARLCVCMYSGTRSKDTRRKSFRGTRKIRDEKKGEAIDRPLHWVNMQILDHRFGKVELCV